MEKNVKVESASSSVEVTLTSLCNPVKEGVNVTALQAEKSDTLATSCQENVWICDTGASTHVMWSNKDVRDVQDMQMLRLRHTGTGGTIESTAMIDISGVFMIVDNNMGMQAILKECGYNKDHNFTLLSMSRLLHKQCWKITCGDESLIGIENGKGGVINLIL